MYYTGLSVLSSFSHHCSLNLSQRDPFAIHRQHMNRMLSGSFGFGPLLGITDGTTPGARQAGRRMQAGAVSPFGMLGMAGGFIDMFGMMNDMIGNMEHMTSGANCQTFTSSTVISYSNMGDGPKVYQETSEMRSAPGGVRRRPRCVIPAGGCWFCWGRLGFHWWLSVGHPQHFCFAVSCELRNVL